MSEFLKIDGDPNELHGTAGRLQAMGARMQAAAEAASSKINSLTAGAPWGADELGKGFFDIYNQSVQSNNGQDGHLGEVALDDLSASGPALTTFGTNVHTAVASYTLNDDNSASDIGSLGG